MGSSSSRQVQDASTPVVTAVRRSVWELRKLPQILWAGLEVAGTVQRKWVRDGPENSAAVDVPSLRLLPLLRWRFGLLPQGQRQR